MDDTYQVFKSILEDNCKGFIDKTRDLSDIGPYKDIRRDVADFPIFKPANDEFFEYRYFEKALEHDLREMLINPTIGSYFEYNERHEKTDVKCRFPEVGNYLVGFNNEGYENIVPFEFIIDTGLARIGYRYTTMVEREGENYIDNQLTHYALDHIEIIKWEETYKPSKWNESDGRLKYVTAKDFFNDYFDESIYDMFIKTIKKAVHDANEIIGFQTIPNLSLRYLSAFKQRIDSELQNIEYGELSYHVLKKGNKKKYSHLEDYSFNSKDISILKHNFIERSMYKALTGEKPFAKCFITAEYLYKIFSEGNEFDYTAVISGYSKAVELLLEHIVKIDLEHSDSYEKNYISKKRDKQKKQSASEKPVHRKKGGKPYYLIPFNDHNVKNNKADLTMGSLIYYLYDNEDKWEIEKENKDLLYSYLECYKDEIRNEYFHKGVLDCDEAKLVRDNTIFILYLLLGGCNIFDRIPSPDKYFGFLSNNDKAMEFDRLYKALKNLPRVATKYLIIDTNGNEIKLVKLFDQPRPKYDDHGNMSKSEMLFVRVDTFQIGYEDAINSVNDNNLYSININNIPRSIDLWFSEDKIKPLVW